MGWRLNLHRYCGVKQPLVGSGYECKRFTGDIGWFLAASFALVVRQSLSSACPRLCLSVVLQGQPTSFPRQQQVHGATGRLANGAGTAREGDISLHQTVTSSSKCHRLQHQFLLCVLPAVPAAASARCSPRSSLCVPIPGSPAGTGASPAGWDELLRGAISAAGDRKYPAALCGVGKFLTLRVRSSAVHTVIKCEIWGNNTTPSPLAVHIHWHRLRVAIQIRAVLPRCFSHQAVIPAPHGPRYLLVPRCLPAPHTSQGEQAAPPTPALGEGRGCTGCLLEPSWTCPHQGLHLVPA